MDLPLPSVALRVDAVTKVFGGGGRLRLPNPFRAPSPPKSTVAVDAVSLVVPRGEIYGILGANGSGKSTLIRLFSTLLVPDAGTVTVFGFDVVRDDMAVKRLINRVSVEAAFFRVLSPMENLLYAARMYGMDAATATSRAVEILRQLGIEVKQLSQPLEKMSRGQQQKVAIARAFLTSPVLLLLDEPTTGLDPRSKREVQQFVLDLRQRHDATVVLTTHDMDEADRLCDRVAVLQKGKIIAEDSPAGLKARFGASAASTLEDAFIALTGQSLEEEPEPVEA
jgi:ABC-2 type transport system ATP-binding protein